MSQDIIQYAKHLGDLLVKLTLVTTEMVPVPLGRDYQAWL